MNFEIKGTKIVELTFLEEHLTNPNSTCLIIGEREGYEGIIQTVNSKIKNSITCMDITDISADAPLANIIKSQVNVDFINADFIDIAEDKKYEYIVCISVLEHFGLNYNGHNMYSEKFKTNDVIKWNYDVVGLHKMISLLSNDSKIILTLPIGYPIMSGDCNADGMPFLRRYDINRINIFRNIIKNKNMKFIEKFYMSENFVDWYETDETCSYPQHIAKYNNMSTPNTIWGIAINSQ
jgi:hypothetical protein